MNPIETFLLCVVSVLATWFVVSGIYDLREQKQKIASTSWKEKMQTCTLKLIGPMLLNGILMRSVDDE